MTSATAHIRLASLQDAREIGAMSRDLIEEGLGWSWRPRRIAAAIRDPNTCAIVAEASTSHSQAARVSSADPSKHSEEEPTIAGFAIMNFKEVRAHLCLLAVRPAQRQRGTGRRLLAWLEESALVAGIELLRLEVRAGNSGARSFYRALGYDETATRTNYYRGVEDAIVLERRLRPAESRPLTLN